MVPLRAEFGSEYRKSLNDDGAPTRPVLVLHDTTKLDTVSDCKPAVTRRRKSQHGWERALFGMAVMCAVLFLICTCVASLWQHAVASYVAALQKPAPVVTVHVNKGDTLWRYAARYGDPNSYILDRVQTIAHENHLSSTASLVPGQSLHITVQNPTEIAKLNTVSHTRLASATVR